MFIRLSGREITGEEPSLKIPSREELLGRYKEFNLNNGDNYKHSYISPIYKNTEAIMFPWTNG